MIPDRHVPCPPAATLSAWLDDELPERESDAIRSHIGTCAECRDHVLGWVYSVRRVAIPATVPAEPEAGCPGAEALTVYSEGEAVAAEAAALEAHLQACTRCASEVLRLMQLRRALETAVRQVTPAPEAPGERDIAPSGRPLRARDRRAGAPGWRTRWREVASSTWHALASPWPALAVAATVVLVVGVGRFLLFGTNPGELGFRGVPQAPQLEVRADAAAARARPDDDEPILATLSRGTLVTRLEESGEWTRVQLPDGRRVWMRTVQLTNAAGGGTQSHVSNE
jgi:anti-sigma factor RsiW